MKLFNFLKKKKTHSFELLLQKAADKPAFRTEFLKRLLTENLVVITKDNLRSEGYNLLKKNDLVSILSLEDGRIPVFTSTERIFDKGIVKQQIKFFECKGEDLFNLIQGKSVILNPYSDYGKELNADEIISLLDGSIFKSKKIVVTKGADVQIGQPSEYPTDIVKALITLFSDDPEVIAAYLGWIYQPDTNDPPHYIFAIDSNGDWDRISEKAGTTAQQILGPDVLIDFTKIGHNGFMNEYFTRRTKPFYTRPA